jgi:nucleoid DNA-binding protein
MIPKKPEKIIKQVAEDLDLSVNTVDDIVGFYYKALRKKLSELDELRINVPGLGHFSVKSYSLRRSIEKNEKIKSKLNPEVFSNYPKIKKIETKLEVLHKAEKKYKEFLEIKNNFKNEKQSKRNLEEPETDS